MKRNYTGKGISPLNMEKGFTLIELMVAMAVAAVVAMTGFALFSASNTSYKEQEGVGEAQQNARVAIDRMARDFRMAGFGLEPYAYPVTIGSTFNQAITVSDSSTGPDSVTIVGIGYYAGTLVNGQNTGGVGGQDYLCYLPGPAGEKFIKDGKVIPERKYINVDGIFFAELDTILPAGDPCPGGKILPLNTKNILRRDLRAGAVYIVQAVEYMIRTDNLGCSTDFPCLATKDYTGLRKSGWQVLAEGIADIQFAYGIDTNYDKKMDDINLDGAYTSADFVSSTANPKYIIAARVSVAAISRIKDKSKTFTPPVLENHSGTASPYRTRVLTKVVKMRNPPPSNWLAP